MGSIPVAGIRINLRRLCWSGNFFFRVLLFGIYISLSLPPLSYLTKTFRFFFQNSSIIASTVFVRHRLRLIRVSAKFMSRLRQYVLRSRRVPWRRLGSWQCRYFFIQPWIYASKSSIFFYIFTCFFFFNSISALLYYILLPFAFLLILLFDLS